MKVKDLIKKLEEFDQDMEVVCCWEGCQNHIADIYPGADVTSIWGGMPIEHWEYNSDNPVLYIDCDDGVYKNEFQEAMK